MNTDTDIKQPRNLQVYLLNLGQYLFFIAAFTVSLFSQAPVGNGSVNDPQKSAGSPNDQTTFQITLARSVCYGTCASYEVTVSSDGKILYNGKKFVKISGQIEDKVTGEQLRQLQDEIKKAKYFSLRTSYADEKDGCMVMGSDSPWVETSVQINTRKRTIRHYLGCYSGSKKFDAELARLLQLERRIDQIINIERWIGTKEERSRVEYFKRIN